MTLNLDPPTPAAAAATARALLASAKSDLTLDIWCCECGRRGTRLARASETTAGPLFISHWVATIPDVLPLYENGQKLTAKQARNRRAAHLVAGDLSAGDEVHGVIAMLTAECPDLMVRCIRHGDAVLDPDDVLKRLRARRVRSWSIPPGDRLMYAPPAWMPPTAEHAQHTTTVVWRSTAGLTPAEVSAILKARYRQ